ncbi:MAG: hypothetical protein QXL31_05955 [Thermosphaera sp.]
MVCAVGDLPPEDWQQLIEEARRVGRPIKVDFSGKVVVLDEGVGPLKSSSSRWLGPAGIHDMKAASL